MKETIEKAAELLQPITFEPQDTAYFVTKNDEDAGGEDYCINCIKNAVKEARKNYKEQRQALLDKYDEIEKTGCYQGKKLDREYSADEIAQSKKRELKEYPARVTFSYEGHDPDFSGGKHEPGCCADCGEYFYTDFEPDFDEAENLAREYEYDMKKENKISEELKWKLDTAFNNFEYADEDVQEILFSIAEKIVKAEGERE